MVLVLYWNLRIGQVKSKWKIWGEGQQSERNGVASDATEWSED